MTEKLASAIAENQSIFDVSLDPTRIARLAEYFKLIMDSNAILHLVAPCSEEEFATRHILESLTMLEHLPGGSRLTDIGTGSGLPALPCLLMRDDLKAVLIESKIKKTAFLSSAIESLGLESRVSVINKQFEEAAKPDAGFVSCRALDKFVDKLPRILKWSKGRQFLFFGGPALGEQLRGNRVHFTEKLMPLSERRFLFHGRA